jgi:hypothetical protein
MPSDALADATIFGTLAKKYEIKKERRHKQREEAIMSINARNSAS